MPRGRAVWLLAAAVLLILALLAAAWLRWRAMVGELETMTRQLQATAAQQQRLQRQLAETRRLLEAQKARLRALEAGGGLPASRGEAAHERARELQP